jgi:hypothetical protein
LPEGWRVVQLDSGHYMGTDGNLETPITVNRFHARKWCWDISDKIARASTTGHKR